VFYKHSVQFSIIKLSAAVRRRRQY